MKCIVWSLLLCFLQASQEMPVQQGAGPQGVASRQDYRIGPGDVLSIGVLGLNEFDQTIRVSNSGKVHIPHLGILKVVDMTPSQLESAIAGKLAAVDLVKEPWVQVRVVEYRAHPTYILGEVMQPGQFLIGDEMYVMDLISLAAGFNEVASPVGYLYRRLIKTSESTGEAVKESNAEEVVEINFQQLYDGSHPELNIKLRGGDVLYVPQRQENFYFVVGDVRTSGAFEIPSGQQVLTTQAIAKAGGPMKTAKMSKGMLMRYDPKGNRQEQAVDFKAILDGRRPDFPVMPNDIIFIPGSSAKTLGYGLLAVIPGIAQGILIFR
jgi:polysaccharide export outer membrane protein